MRGNNDRRYGARYKGLTPLYPSARVLLVGEGACASLENGVCERVEPLADSVIAEGDGRIVTALALLGITGILPLAISWALISIFDALDCWWVVPMGYVAAAICAYRRWVR